MSLKVSLDILNQKGTPAFYSDTLANRPAFGFAGRVFISTDTGQIFEDTGSAWTLIADAGVGGGSLETVTTNGNTTDKGIVITANGLSSNSITNTGNTQGSVLFAGAGGLESQSNASFFWDNTNKRLGIGINTPGAPLDVHSTGTNAQFNGTGTNNAYLQFQNAGTSKWRIGNTYSAGANNFDLYNNSLASTALSFNLGTNAATFNNSVTATSFVKTGGTASQFLKADGSVDSSTYIGYTGGISTNQVLRVTFVSGTPYLQAGTITDDGTTVSTTSRLQTTGDTLSVNNSAGNVQIQINNQTATTGKQYYLNSKSTGVLGIGNNTTGDIFTFDGTTGIGTNTKGLRVTSASGDNQVWIYGTSPGYRLYDTLPTPTINAFVGLATAANNFIQGTANGDMAIGTSTGGKIYIGTASGTINPQLTITNSNTIGINVTTPLYQTHIVGNGTNAFLGISNQGSANGNRQLRIGFGGNGSDTFASIQGTRYNTADDVNIAMQVGGGYIGVGLNNPTAKFEVNGAIRVSDEATYGATILHVTPSGAGGIAMYADGGQYLHFGINSTDTLNISASNNVLIGTNTDGGNGKLVVEGLQGILLSSSGRGQRQIYFGSAGDLIFYNSSNAPYLSSVGVWTSISDINIKKDIIDIKYGLNDLMKLKPRSYKMKLNDLEQIGFISQEVEQIIPEVISEPIKGGNKGLSYDNLLALAIKSIQELNYKIENLKN